MKPERVWEVYVLVDPRDGAVRYVGVTTIPRNRLYCHVCKARAGRTHRDCWIRSLLRGGLRPVYRAIDRVTDGRWQAAEQRWIAHYRQTSDLTNHTDGGEGNVGWVPSLEQRQARSLLMRGRKYPPGRVGGMKGRNHSAETRALIAAAGTGRRHTAASKAKLSAAHSGRTRTPEQRAFLSGLRRGTKLSEEHKAKIAASTTGRRPVLRVATGEVFASITAASKALGVTEPSIGNAIRKGYRCKGSIMRFV